MLTLKKLKGRYLVVDISEETKKETTTTKEGIILDNSTPGVVTDVKATVIAIGDDPLIAGEYKKGDILMLPKEHRGEPYEELGGYRIPEQIVIAILE